MSCSRLQQCQQILSAAAHPNPVHFQHERQIISNWASRLPPNSSLVCLTANQQRTKWVGFKADQALSSDPSSFPGLSYVGSHADNNECRRTRSSMTCTALEKVKKTLLLCCHSQKVSMNKGLATSCESSPGSSSCFTYLRLNFAPAEQAA